MSDKNLKVGQRVEVTGKEVRGKIAYIGVTSFAPGKWIGLILDEPKGKNNGTLRGTTYFTCPDNYGMFVRISQLSLLDESDNVIEENTEERQPRSRLSSSGSVRSLPGITKPTAIRRKSPIKTLQPKNKLNNLPPSASSSRLSMSSSRQSLLGSRSQLASPSTDRPSSTATASVSGADPERKNSLSPPDSVTPPKRASFVEVTGFLETLKPQFTPGQALMSPSPAPQPSVEDKLQNLQQQQEIEDLKKQNIDLSEKLETLKIRRNEDKERLREYEKMKTQFEQLHEFKSKIIEAQSSLQRELQRARQEAKDAIEARERHQEEMAELSENVEMITLDKEMAEEKADTLQIELEQAKERIEELTLDLEILQTEMSNRCGSDVDGGVIRTGNGNVTGGVSQYEFKQLEQQNVRLRETLVRLRDVTAHDKHEIQKVSKELDTKKSEVAELQRTKEKLSQKVDELEAQVVDLQEQVDAALGAEEMVEQLAEKKMELEDKVKLLEEEVKELEALEEVHEQLIESNHDLEMDLREELDMALAAKREMLREKEAALETVVDRDQTILKFRELVQKLNDQIVEMREKVTQNNENNKLSPTKNSIAETIDFKQMFAESKAFTRAIDVQLRQIDLSQANEHIRMFTAYMPDTFMNRGSDHDAILVILLISRIVFKSGIIVSQARDRFPSVTTIDKNVILQGHSVQQFAFKSRLLYHIHNLQSVMHQFLYGLNTCKPETLLKAGASLPELVAQEKIVDGVIELLKVNQLDENSSTENLEKCVMFFNAMNTVVFNEEVLINEAQLLKDTIASMGASCDSIYTDAAVIRAMIAGGDDTSESGLLMQYIIQNIDNIKQQLKLIKRRLPQDPHVTKCGLASKTVQNIRLLNDQIGKIVQVLHLTAKSILHNVTVENESDPSISHQKLWEVLATSCEQVYEQDDRGPSQNIKNTLSAAGLDLTQVAQYLLDNEYEIMSIVNAKEEKPIAPIVLRAQFVKKQLEETKTLTATLENRDAEIKQLKMAAKMKQNELSEMQIRKDIAEKKLSVLQHDLESSTQKLQKQYEETVALLRKKERDYEETMDHLQKDIDSLEDERGALRDKLKGLTSKKGGDLKNSMAFDISASSPHVAQEIALLKRVLLEERNERLKLQAEVMKKKLQKLEPIYVPQPKDKRLTELENELAKVKYDWVMSMMKMSEFPEANTSRPNVPKLIQNHRYKQKYEQEDIKAKASELAAAVMKEYLERKPYRAANGDFASFPNIELTKALKSMVK
ncbi:dynactin subunit 1 isoform X3 [Condylostylus longicornis]|uniref:dynactin subunit 1 isoform X3 n=1 Tax=Condylostylus longicornis TaxID=2530218 RepID=UPI00244DD28F|nr:dynactin subunit 1 isoform X3 [Condylostylus longicornis]